MDSGMNMIETLARERGFHFPPIPDVEILGEYLLCLEGSLPSLHHVTLTEAERSVLDAWQESCQNFIEEELIENQMSTLVVLSEDSSRTGTTLLQ